MRLFGRRRRRGPQWKGRAGACPDTLAISLTDWVVLGVLSEEPRHGFAVAKELGRDAELGQLWTVRRPLVYRAIDHLLELVSPRPDRWNPAIRGPTER